MSTRLRIALFIVAVLVLPFALAIFLTRIESARRRAAGGTNGEQGTRPGAGPLAGTSAGPEVDPLPPEPTGEITSPSGKVWRFGATDDLGYVLPLDVRRPRPSRPPGLAQDREAILALRGLAESRLDGFEEHRLSPDDGHTQNETAIDTDGETVIAAFHRFTDTSLMLGVSRSTARPS